jgi:hypothetical protein
MLFYEGRMQLKRIGIWITSQFLVTFRPGKYDDRIKSITRI